MTNVRSAANSSYRLNPATLHFPVDEQFFCFVNPLRSQAVKIVNKVQRDVVDRVLQGASIPIASRDFGVSRVGVEALFDKLRSMEVLGTQETVFSEQEHDHAPNSMSIWLHMTDRCNLGCTYCYIPNIRQGNDFDPQLFERLEEKILQSFQVNELKSVRLRLAGGEPFYKFRLWKDQISGMKKRLRAAGINFHIGCLTNMTVLSEEMLDYVVQNEIGLGISLDGIGSTHDRSRPFVNGRGSYDTVIKNIKRLKKRNAKFNIMVVVSDDNVDQMAELTRFFVDNDMSFRFSDVKGMAFDRKRFQAGLRESFSVLSAAIDGGYKFEQRYQLCDLNVGNVSKTACSMGRSGGAIYTDGRIYFCHTETGSEASVGSIEEDAELFEIFERGAARQRPERHSDCETCRYRQVCARGCPIYRDENNKSPECAVFHDVIPEVYRLIAKQRVKNIREAIGQSAMSVVAPTLEVSIN